MWLLMKKENKIVGKTIAWYDNLATVDLIRKLKEEVTKSEIDDRKNYKWTIEWEVV